MARSAHLAIDIAAGALPATTCCGASLAPAQEYGRGEALPMAALAAAFALSILAHSLTLGALPLAGTLLAPAPSLAYLPFLALLAGALAGARFGAPLVVRHGWRTHAALAASCGAFAASLAALAIFVQAYPLLIVAAALMGVAQAMGFGLRHGGGELAGAAAAPLRGGMLLVAGMLAALGGPQLAQTVEAASAPYLMLGTFLLVALVHLASLPLAAALAPVRPQAVAHAASVSQDAGAIRAVRLARLSWFAMAAGMAHAPLAMVGCGIAPGGVGSVIAWHVLAMYAPAAPAGLLVARFGATAVAGAGGAVALAGLAMLLMAGTVPVFLAAMMLLGIGWSLATVAAQAAQTGGASALLSQERGLFAAAFAGALAGVAIA